MTGFWRYDQVAWGETMCANRRCVRPAECLFEDEPWCADCADLLFDRLLAISELPRRLVDGLPPLFES